MHTYVHTYIHAHIHPCTHTHTHTHTQIHTHNPLPPTHPHPLINVQVGIAVPVYGVEGFSKREYNPDTGLFDK